MGKLEEWGNKEREQGIIYDIIRLRAGRYIPILIKSLNVTQETMGRKEHFQFKLSFLGHIHMLLSLLVGVAWGCTQFNCNV